MKMTIEHKHTNRRRRDDDELTNGGDEAKEEEEEIKKKPKSPEIKKIESKMSKKSKFYVRRRYLSGTMGILDRGLRRDEEVEDSRLF